MVVAARHRDQAEGIGDPRRDRLAERRRSLPHGDDDPVAGLAYPEDAQLVAGARPRPGRDQDHLAAREVDSRQMEASTRHRAPQVVQEVVLAAEDLPDLPRELGRAQLRRDVVVRNRSPLAAAGGGGDEGDGANTRRPSRRTGSFRRGTPRSTSGRARSRGWPDTAGPTDYRGSHSRP